MPNQSVKYFRNLVFFLSFLIVFVPAKSPAQGASVDTVGKVTTKSASSISIATPDKKNPILTFVIDQNTTITRGRAATTIQAVEEGELARVVAEKKDGQQVATMITVRDKP
jgi:hypothetical protein